LHEIYTLVIIKRFSRYSKRLYMR